MTIDIDILKQAPGIPLTPGDPSFPGPWNDSPERLMAQEAAPALTVTRIGPSQVRLQWDPDTGQAIREDVWISFEVADSPESVDHIVLDWGDGSTPEVLPGYGLPTILLRRKHTYLAASVGVTVSTYETDNTLIESTYEAITLARSSEQRISQYRVERYKGRPEYSEPNRRWVPDWADYTGASQEKDYNDYDADDAWNWGYRLWLRDVDDQDRADLTMIPSAWQTTGTGEGS